MEATNSIYLKIYQNDGRIENFHFEMTAIDPVLDMMNDIVKRGAWFTTISREQFFTESAKAKDIHKIQKIAIHRDAEIDGDAAGDKIGFMEHYELNN